MDYVYGIVGFVIIMTTLGWYQGRARARQLRKDEANTMTVKELVSKLKKLDPADKIIVDIKFADYDITPRDLDDTHDDLSDPTDGAV